MLIVLALALAPLLQTEPDFTGVVSVAQHGEKSEAAPGTDASLRFNLASAGKMFTAVAIAQLVDAGKVRLDDPIGAQVKGLTAKASAATIRQLLTHTSGLGSFLRPENLPAIEKARTASDLLPLVASEEPAGTGFQYSNTGFLLLGMLVERISGQSYGEYLAAHVFQPAGMTASGLDPKPDATRAAGMTMMGSSTPRPAQETAMYGNPAGGCYSTAADLQRFFAALLAGKLTSAAMLQQMTSKQVAGPHGQEYGFGFGTGELNGHRWFGHNGGAPGANVEAVVFPGDKTSIVILSNRDPPGASKLLHSLREQLFTARR